MNRVRMTLIVTLALLCIVWSWTLPAGVRLAGRFAVDRRAEAFTADWPSAGIVFHVQASSDAVVIVDMEYVNCDDASKCNFFVGAFLDGAQVAKFQINSTASALHWAVPLADTTTAHELQLLKVTEASYSDAQGLMQLGVLRVTGAHIVDSPPPHEKKKKLLFVGDSISAAYGVDGTNPCSFSSSLEDVSHGYALLVARALDAEVSVLAWSGKGVVRNYGDANPVSAEPMPALYNRTLATGQQPQSHNYWAPQRFVADVVVVMLGSNDYSTAPAPADEQFVAGYLALLQQIHADYPLAAVLAMCAPMNHGPQCANIAAAASAATPAAAFFVVPVATLDSGYGCDSHPNQSSQQAIAQAVLPTIKGLLEGSR
jgi:lysophospholipase L1-like esterase